jgi:heavy-metal resistance protein
MRKALIILAAGLALAVGGYAGFCFFSCASNRELLRGPAPELAWLKKEFNLSDGEYARIMELHAAYLPGCQERCRRIAAKDTELKKLLAQTNVLTPEIERTLNEAAQLKVECQIAMLKHFAAVSETMPPEQGKRYLAWVQEKTFLSDHGMKSTSEAVRPSHDHHE